MCLLDHDEDQPVWDGDGTLCTSSRAPRPHRTRTAEIKIKGNDTGVGCWGYGGADTKGRRPLEVSRFPTRELGASAVWYCPANMQMRRGRRVDRNSSAD